MVGARLWAYVPLFLALLLGGTRGPRCPLASVSGCQVPPLLRRPLCPASLGKVAVAWQGCGREPRGCRQADGRMDGKMGLLPAPVPSQASPTKCWPRLLTRALPCIPTDPDPLLIPSRSQAPCVWPRAPLCAAGAAPGHRVCSDHVLPAGPRSRGLGAGLLLTQAPRELLVPRGAALLCPSPGGLRPGPDSLPGGSITVCPVLGPSSREAHTPNSGLTCAGASQQC